MTYPTFGRASTSSAKRCTPEGPARSEATSRFEPMPMLITEKGAPDGSVGTRLERMSGQVPFALLVAHAPSVMESPNATATLLVAGAHTCRPETMSTSVVVFPQVVARGSVVDAVKLPGLRDVARVQSGRMERRRAEAAGYVHADRDGDVLCDGERDRVAPDLRARSEGDTRQPPERQRRGRLVATIEFAVERSATWAAPTFRVFVANLFESFTRTCVPPSFEKTFSR